MTADSSAARAIVTTLLSPWTPPAELERLRDAAGEGTIDWVAVATCANRHSLAPALHSALVRHGFSDLIPEQFRAYLEEIHRLNRARNAALLDQLFEVIALLNRAGIEPVILKGGAALLTGLYPDPGDRLMCDLDLLVGGKDLDTAVEALEAAGYRVPAGKAGQVAAGHYLEAKHAAPLCHPAAPAAVELHRRLLDHPLPGLEAETVLPLALPAPGLPAGHRARLLEPTDALLYCLAHSELDHTHHQREIIDLRQLVEFLTLAGRHRAQLDLERLRRLRQDPQFATVAGAWLELARTLGHADLLPDLPADAAILDHCARAAATDPWRQRGKLLRFALADLWRTFSPANLAALYPDDPRGPFSLRLRHAGVLYRRYARPGAWRRKARNLIPF